jgi:hypothetical protein
MNSQCPQKVVEVEECNLIRSTLVSQKIQPEIVHWNNVREMFTERTAPGPLLMNSKQVQPCPLGHLKRLTEGTKKAYWCPDKNPVPNPTGKIEVYSTTLELYGLTSFPISRNLWKVLCGPRNYGRSFPSL